MAPKKPTAPALPPRDPNGVGKAKALMAIQRRLNDLDEFTPTSAEDLRLKEWEAATGSTLRNVFGEEHEQTLSFAGIGYYPVNVFGNASDTEYRDAVCNGVASAKGALRTAIDEVQTFWPDETLSTSLAPLDTVLRISDRFPISARRLRRRYSTRQPLLMVDEYDVQYLLGALLDLHFDDIQPEEWVPSYAGGTSRIDFVLRPERIAIETKMTRDSLGEREVGSQLLVDIGRYAALSHVDTLVCFVYDPQHHLSNPRGLEGDLQRQPSRLTVRALIRS